MENVVHAGSMPAHAQFLELLKASLAFPLEVITSPCTAPWPSRTFSPASLRAQVEGGGTAGCRRLQEAPAEGPRRRSGRRGRPGYPQRLFGGGSRGAGNPRWQERGRSGAGRGGCCGVGAAAPSRLCGALLPSSGQSQRGGPAGPPAAAPGQRSPCDARGRDSFGSSGSRTGDSPATPSSERVDGGRRPGPSPALGVPVPWLMGSCAAGGGLAGEHSKRSTA